MTWRTNKFSTHNLTAELVQQAKFYDVLLKDAFYLFDSEEDVPDGFEMPDGLSHADWSDMFCEPCADAIIAESIAKGMLKRNPERSYRWHGDYDGFYYGPISVEGETDSEGNCGRCGVDLDVCTTDYGIRAMLEALEDGRESEWWFKGDRGHGWSRFDLMLAAKLLDRGVDSWSGSSEETKERNATILRLALEVRRDFTVTAAEERDARIREAGRGLCIAAKTVGSALGKWWERITRDIDYIEETNDA